MLFLSNVFSNVLCNVFVLSTICQEFDIVICMNTLEDGWTPIVHVALSLFWSPFALFIDPHLFCQGKWSAAIAKCACIGKL
jgi:hypothetical protein